MMNETHRDLILGHLNNTLSDQEKQQFSALLQSGEIDVLDIVDAASVLKELDDVPVPIPSADMSKQFYAMLDREKQLLHEAPVFSAEPISMDARKASSQRYFWYAAAVFVAGLLVGDVFTPFSQRQAQMDTLTAEVSDMRELLMMRLLADTSPAERMRAVNISQELSASDSKVVDALLRTLNHDPNVNVRIAAVQALVGHASHPEVRAGLIHSIDSQESPVVQVALADAMLDLQESNSVDAFQKLLEREQLDTNVRDKLTITIAALK